MKRKLLKKVKPIYQDNVSISDEYALKLSEKAYFLTEEKGYYLVYQ